MYIWITQQQKMLLFIWFDLKCEIFRRDTKCEYNRESNHIQMANGIGTMNACLDTLISNSNKMRHETNAKHLDARIQFSFIFLATVVWSSECFSYFTSPYRIAYFTSPRNVSFFYVHTYTFFVSSPSLVLAAQAE